jgi:hypothetical protein
MILTLSFMKILKLVHNFFLSGQTDPNTEFAFDVDSCAFSLSHRPLNVPSKVPAFRYRVVLTFTAFLNCPEFTPILLKYLSKISFPIALLKHTAN